MTRSPTYTVLWENIPSENEAAILVKKAADGLSYCHSKHVIHRDINTRNLLIGYDEEVGDCAAQLSSYISEDVDIVWPERPLSSYFFSRLVHRPRESLSYLEPAFIPPQRLVKLVLNRIYLLMSALLTVYPAFG